MNILDAMSDRKLFGKTFKPRSRGGDTWGPWRAFLSVLFGLAVDPAYQALVRESTGRSDLAATNAGFTEAYAICGRRGGKSIISSLIVAYLACLRDYTGVLAPGEVGVVLILASDRQQARVIFSYVKALIEGAPALRNLIVGATKESIDLANQVRIAIHTSSFKAVRGYSIVACVCDELAFWQADDGSNPAGEVLKAVRPGMASIPGAVLMGLSSPYSKRGALFDLFKAHYAREGAPVLLWKAPSAKMNSTISEATVRASRAQDPVAARSEWDAEFRDDLEGFISLEIVESRIVSGRYELPPRSDVTYTAFVDPSGGRVDSFVLAIAHREGDKSILDLVREVVAPFSPADAVNEFREILKDYRIGSVVGDNYAGEWPADEFKRHGFQYKVAGNHRSQLYLELLPLLMSARCELLDHARLKNQLVGLERRTGRSGKDAIDHTQGLHDDVANAVAGALVEVAGHELVLALVEFYKEELAARDAARISKPADDVTCPQCGSRGIAKRGPILHCSNCAHEFGGPPKEIGPSPRAGIFESSRRNL